MHPIYLSVVVAALAACNAYASSREPLVGGPCEGCEAVFEGRPATLAPSARIAATGQPGERLVIKGVVTDASRRPAAGVIVYAYHTDAKGIYPGRPGVDEARTTASQRHGALRGFARTDAEGRYAFETIRPASYPFPNAPPQHVHMHVVEPGRCHYVIDDIVFTDDPRLPADARKRDRPRGGSGVVTPAKHNGAWGVRRDITLGANVPGYDGCGAK
jgi:protocatechuate 3,4-dioxygenase beta subunit